MAKETQARWQGQGKGQRESTVVAAEQEAKDGK